MVKNKSFDLLIAVAIVGLAQFLIVCGLIRETPAIGKRKDVFCIHRNNIMCNSAMTVHYSTATTSISMVPISKSDELITKKKSQSTSGRINSRVRNIMTLLEERYPPLRDDDDDDIKSVRRDWKKTRNYLYNADSKLSIRQIQQVLDFLDQRFPKQLSRLVLQECPRILRKPVDSFLIPTADFLLELWGQDLFVQAIERNPSLLLTNGVGYVAADGHKKGETTTILSTRMFHRKKTLKM